MWSTVARRRPVIDLRAERQELPDGDFVDLAWTRPEPSARRAPIVLVLHGLEGSVESPYAAGLLAAVAARGWRGVLMHFRGCSGPPNRLDRAYHSGDTADFDTIIGRLVERFPDAPMATVGYSLGANVLLKWLGESVDPGDRPLVTAVAVSPPFNLAACADQLNVGVAKIYQGVFIRSLKRKYGRKRRLPAWVRKIETIRQWDELVTGPVHGFAGADDYYARCSCAGFMKRIAVPTLVIHAENDPFLPSSAIPPPQAVGEAVDLAVMPNGGHVGFVGGPSPLRPEYWLEHRIPSYLATHLRTEW